MRTIEIQVVLKTPKLLIYSILRQWYHTEPKARLLSNIYCLYHYARVDGTKELKVALGARLSLWFVLFHQPSAGGHSTEVNGIGRIASQNQDLMDCNFRRALTSYT